MLSETAQTVAGSSNCCPVLFLYSYSVGSATSRSTFDLRQCCDLSTRTSNIEDTVKINDPVATCEVTMIESEKPLARTRNPVDPGNQSKIVGHPYSQPIAHARARSGFPLTCQQSGWPRERQIAAATDPQPGQHRDKPEKGNNHVRRHDHRKSAGCGTWLHASTAPPKPTVCRRAPGLQPPSNTPELNGLSPSRAQYPFQRRPVTTAAATQERKTQVQSSREPWPESGHSRRPASRQAAPD